jgi:hypothetical protein
MLTALAKVFCPSLPGRWSKVAVLLGCFLLVGCAQQDVRGDRFAEDDLSRMSRKVRPHNSDKEAGEIESGRASQVAADLGFN